MTAPQPIPGTEQQQQQQQQKPKTRTRSQTFAYNRLDADGNVHHLPPDAPVLARSPGAISGNSSAGGGGGGGILGMLGLSPKSSTSNSTIIPFSVSAAAESPSSSSSYYSSSTGEEAPEAVTPPLLNRVNSRSNDKAAGNTLPAIEQLDEDVFDDDFPLTSTGNTTDYRRAPYHMRSASVGRPNFDSHKSRRSSWSPAAAADRPLASNGEEPARSASPSTVDKWLKAQEKTAATTTSPTWAWYSQQRDSGFKDGQSSSSSAIANPIGLFRRLSVSSAPRRPAPAAPASVTSETSEISDRPGRSLEKSQGPAPRKLSPMGKRMLMGHFHQFS